MDERPVYVERTWAPAWFLIVMWAACLVGVASMSWGVYSQEMLDRPFGNNPGPTWILVGSAGLFLLIPLGITVFGCRLDVCVWNDRVTAAFGPLTLFRKTVAYGDIHAVDAVTYRPICDFGGWGIRFRPGRTAWTIRGNRAVCMSLASGKDFYVGTRFPHRLAERIQVAKQRHAAKGGR